VKTAANHGFHKSQDILGHLNLSRGWSFPKEIVAKLFRQPFIVHAINCI
jgi:hypothetical protein